VGECQVGFAAENGSPSTSQEVSGSHEGGRGGGTRVYWGQKKGEWTGIRLIIVQNQGGRGRKSTGETTWIARRGASKRKSQNKSWERRGSGEKRTKGPKRCSRQRGGNGKAEEEKPKKLGGGGGGGTEENGYCRPGDDWLVDEGKPQREKKLLTKLRTGLQLQKVWGGGARGGGGGRRKGGGVPLAEQKVRGEPSCKPRKWLKTEKNTLGGGTSGPGHEGKKKSSEKGKRLSKKGGGRGDSNKVKSSPPTIVAKGGTGLAWGETLRVFFCQMFDIKLGDTQGNLTKRGPKPERNKT